VKARLPWLLLFVGVNLIAAAMIYTSGELLGDVAGLRLHDEGALFWATTLVVLSHVVLLVPVFQLLTRLKVAPMRLATDDDTAGRRIGVFLIVAQLAFWLFNTLTGINVAGNNTNRGDSIFTFVWIFLPVDTLFIIYYALYRDNKYFHANLAIWLVSNLMRGWAGVLLFVIFLEWCRALRRGRVSKVKLIGVGLLILSAYPLLSNLKWVIRASAVTGLTFDTLVTGFLTNLDAVDYASTITLGLEHIIGRLQQVSMMVEVMRLSDLLQQKFALGDFAPFWKEGLHGLVFDRLTGAPRTVYIGVAFTGYETFGWEYDVGDWNVNLSYASWLFIAPHLGVFYIAYTLFLAGLSVVALKKIGMTPLSKDLLWYTWLVYLLAPWLATFIVFIYSLWLFGVLKRIAGGSRRPARAVSTPPEPAGVAHLQT
jgi:hypothetical protein